MVLLLISSSSGKYEKKYETVQIKELGAVQIYCDLNLATSRPPPPFTYNLE